MKISLKIRFWDIFITTLISLFLTIIIYNFLYNNVQWHSLKDFFVGVSIYNNHNKYLDIYIYFIYLIIFFCILPLISTITNKFFNSNKEKQQNNEAVEKIKSFLPKLKKLQYLIIFGYIFLHPFNGEIYTKIIVLTVLLIILSIISIYINNKNDKGFSPFSICALFFILFFTSYTTGTAPVDDHHFGEKFGAYLMHNNFNLEYYKDIMLVHGRCDVTSAWLGNFFFNGNNIYGYCLGEALHRNLIFIITTLLTLLIFNNNILYTIPLFLLKVPSAVTMAVCVYIALIQEKMIKKPVFWFWFYIIFSIGFASYWTTIGSFWIIASLPAFIYICIKLPNKKLNFWSAGIFILMLSIIFRNSFFEYLNIAKYYIEGNLASFGNDFKYIESKMPSQTAFEWCYKMFALFFTPIVILEAIKQFKNKSKDISSVFFTVFSLLFVFVSLPYTMGRLDNGHFLRMEYISFTFLCTIMPYWFYKYADIKQKLTAEKILILILCIIMPFSLFYKLPDKIKKMEKSDIKNNTQLYNVGNINIDIAEEKRLTEIKNYIEEKGENTIFLDLTNRGMHYLYLNKEIPIQYTSFYNIVSSKQSVDTVERLRNKIPDIILVYSNNILHDNVFPSLRINGLYRWIFLKQKYKYEKSGNNVFLVKTNNKSIFTNEQLKDLDYYFGAKNLKFLPEAWAASLKTLPVTEIITNYSVEIFGNEIKIRFTEPQKIENTDLLFFNTNEKKSPSDFTISINGSQSKIKCKSKSGKILIPLDNFPSWLLNNKLEEIKIISDINIKSPDVKFYNRIINHSL